MDSLMHCATNLLGCRDKPAVPEHDAEHAPELPDEVDTWMDCLVCHSKSEQVVRDGLEMFTLECKHCICGDCLPRLQKDECPNRCAGVRLPPRRKDVPAFQLEYSGREAMVVIAHGRGSRALVDLPHGMQVVTYADNHAPLYGSEIVQVTKFMESFGHAPKTVIRSDGRGELEGLPDFRQVPNYTLSFQDHNGLQSYIGRSLGIYRAKAGTPSLHPVEMPPDFAEGTNTEAIAKFAATLGFRNVVLLSCKSGDSNIRVEGSHCGYSPGCEDAFMHLIVGQRYDDLKCEPMICARCREPFEPMKITFTKCSFQFHGKVKPSGVKFALPPNTSLQEHVTANQPITVDLKEDLPKSGVMSTSLISWPRRDQC